MFTHLHNLKTEARDLNDLVQSLKNDLENANKTLKRNEAENFMEITCKQL